MSEKKKNPGKVQARIVKAHENIRKADVPTQLHQEEATNSGEWIYPKVDLNGLRTMVSESSILPQCIRAYKNNIAGFGIGVRYIDDEEEDAERAAEFTRAQEIIDLLNTDQDTKEVFEDAIEAREIYGMSYIEVIRNLAGEVVQIEFVREVASIEKTDPLEPYVEHLIFYHGNELRRMKKFRKYRQQIGAKTVYFKEFGDPRIMDNRSGEYVEELDIRYRANELLEFGIGTDPYGEVRWIGQVLGVDGSRRAENLNNNYFINGRHTPLMILVKGGTLTDESFEKLTQYMDEIKGESGQHAFIVLESENAEQRTDFEDQDKPDIEVKDIASILQKDELFQDYLENNRKRVQSAFQLPDLYVGYTSDFNRATAQMAMEVTEQQVFQPERKSLAWIVNNRLLNCYGFKYVEAYFMAPDISNPDDIYKILTVANNAGGLTPNKAKEVLYKQLGEVSENYEGEWGDIPLAISNKQSSTESYLQNISRQLDANIQKARNAGETDELVSVMKSVHQLLGEIKDQQEKE